MELHLIVASGPNKGRAIPIFVLPFVIGRHPMCELRPSSLMVSNRHCGIRRRGGTLIIEDFKSTNGTIVNGQRVVGECELHHADQLQIGPLTFEVRLQASSAVDQRTAIPGSRHSAVLDAAVLILLEHGER